MLKYQLIIHMIALIVRCQAAIRRFSGFPAVSLPRRRFDRKVVYKILIRRDFVVRVEPRKNFLITHDPQPI